MSADLVSITAEEFGVHLALAYATADNFTGVPVYGRADCYLHRAAAEKLARAAELAGALGYRLKIFDAYRPPEAQWVLWNHTPDPDFLADPRRGSPHSRGAAVDVTLIDLKAGATDLDMGTPFDAFEARSYHGTPDIPPTAQANRHLLLGLMTAAGWDFYAKEWWHYQLFDSGHLPLVSNQALPRSMMPS